MHPSLVEFSSQYFYESNIKNSISEESRPRIHGFNWPNNHFRSAVIHVKGQESICHSSLANIQEIEVII